MCFVSDSTVDEAENNLKNIKEEEGRSTGILINWTGEEQEVSDEGTQVWAVGVGITRLPTIRYYRDT